MGRRGSELLLAVAATAVPVLAWRGFVGRGEHPGRFVVAFLLLGVVAALAGAVHRRALGWLGVAGTALMATGALLAAWAINAEGDADILGDGVWRAHFVIMTGSLAVAAGVTRAGRSSRPVVVAAFVASWAFLGAWGVGLAWVAWALAVGRGARPRRSAPSPATSGRDEHAGDGAEAR